MSERLVDAARPVEAGRAAAPPADAASLPAVGEARAPWWRRPGRLRCAVGGAVVAALVVAAVLAPVLAPARPNAQDLVGRLRPPAFTPGGSGAHVLGTDHLGRDILSRIVHGARMSAIVGLAALIVSGVIGTALGLVAGYYGARVDLVVMKLVELFLTIPFVLLALVVMALFGQNVGILITVLCMNRWIHYARVIRGEVLSLRERDFVAGARALGASNARIIARHVLPNTVASLSVVTTFSLATIILLEASLSFLGLGVPPTVPTWGLMLNESRAYMVPSWWTSVFPGLAIFITVLGVNLLGDGIRDAFDPKMKRRV